MKRYWIAAAAVLFVIASVQIGLAGKAVELKPTLSQPGEVLLDDNLNRAELGDQWTAAKGTWQVVDGAIVGREKAEDNHAAVLNCNVPNRNSIIRFSFKLDGVESFNLSYNYAKGHLFRVAVSPGEVSIKLDKDKKDKTSRPQTLATAPADLQPGQWYTLLVEVRGDEVAAEIDGGIKLHASHPMIDTDKPNYRFVTRGAALGLDDVKIWAIN